MLGMSIIGVKPSRALASSHAFSEGSVRRGERGPARHGQAHPRRRPFDQDLPAEAETLGGPAAGAALPLASPLDQAALLHQPAEVLLVERHARERLDALLDRK